MIGNNGYTRRNVKNARAIYGPSIPGLKGKTVKLNIKLPRGDKPIDIPQTLACQYRDVTLLINVMHVNNIPFLVSKAHHLG